MTPGSGNVFADLGLPEPEEALIKSELLIHIRTSIAERALSQAAAAKIMGLTQPEVSKIVRGVFVGFSIERLIKALTALGNKVTLTVEPTDKAA